MNLIDQNFNIKEEKKKSKAPKIILGAIIVVFLLIVLILGYIMYLENTTIKLYLNGELNNNLLGILQIQDDGTIYAPIKEISKYFDYESYNGEYTDKSEEQTKCYVQSESEVVNFALGEDTINKLDLTNSSENYEYINLSNQIKANDGVLYASSDTLEKAFNISFEYNQNTNRIYIYTLPYLVQNYTNQVLSYGYVGVNEDFASQKAILQNMIIVKDEDEGTGVIDLSGNVILEPKYDDIKYLPNVGDFLVTNDDKVGIISKNKETKLPIEYDLIELMDQEAGLYLVKEDEYYGVVDFNGNTIIFIENDEIGIDASKFSKNSIKNKYILAGSVIPVKQDEKWALFDLKGKQITDFEYDEFGYIPSNNKNAMSLLVIPDYDVIVACKDKKYTLINTSGERLMGVVADDIYMTVSSGEEHYYILANDKTYDAIDYLQSRGVTPNVENSKNEEENNNQDENAVSSDEEENTNSSDNSKKNSQ